MVGGRNTNGPVTNLVKVYLLRVLNLTTPQINIGGMTTRPAVPLTDGTLKEFARLSTNRLVVVSFGSVDFLGNLLFEKLFIAFQLVPELNFAWRFVLLPLNVIEIDCIVIAYSYCILFSGSITSPKEVDFDTA